MKNSKNIGFINLDTDLQDKISKLMNLYNGSVSDKDPTAWQTLTDNINATLKDLKDNKADITELAHYLHKGSDKVTKQMLSDELSAIVTSLEKNKYRGIDDKITYSDLAKDTTDRIERTEDRLDYINDYLLNHSVGGGSGSGIDSTLFNNTITGINKHIDDNKDIADAGISKNAADIIDLDKRVSDNESILGNLDNVYQKLNQPVNFNDLPGDVQDTLKILSGSIPFTQNDKDVLNALKQSSGSINVIDGTFADTRNILSVYTNKNYSDIYYVVNGDATGNPYILKYVFNPDDADAGNIINASTVFDGSDASTPIPLYTQYVTTALTEEETVVFNSSFIYSNDTKKLYIGTKWIAQKQKTLLSQDIAISKNSSVSISTADILESALNTNIQIKSEDSNGNLFDVSHIVTLTRYEDKIEIQNELDEDIMINITIRDYMI